MPTRRAAWSAWNYLGKSTEIAAAASKGQAAETKPVFVTYWLNAVRRGKSTLCFALQQSLKIRSCSRQLHRHLRYLWDCLDQATAHPFRRRFCGIFVHDGQQRRPVRHMYKVRSSRRVTHQL